MIQYTCKKPLSKCNLLNQTEWVSRKVPSGITYTRNNLLHSDIGLVIDTTVNIHSAASHQDLLCLLKPVCLNAYGK